MLRLCNTCFYGQSKYADEGNEFTIHTQSKLFSRHVGAASSVPVQSLVPVHVDCRLVDQHMGHA
jgi:hypothetical protein